MPARVDLSEFLGAYLAEMDEHLAQARSRLLAVEEAARATPPRPAARELRDAFRAVHTIKGLSAMVGVEPVVALSHKMEAELRRADRHGAATPAVLELLVRGLAAIEAMLGRLSRGEEVTEAAADLLAALDDVAGSHAATAPRASTELTLPPELASKLAPFELELLVRGAAEGKRAYRVDFEPSAERATRGLTITKVREAIGAFADIVKVVPLSIAGGSGLRFALVVLAADDQAAHLAAVVEGEPASVQLLAGRTSEGAPAGPAIALDDEHGDDDALPPDDGDASSTFGMPLRRNVVRVDVARIDDAMDKLAALIVTRSRLAREVGALADSGVAVGRLVDVVQENARQLRELRGALLRVRMIPIGEVLERLSLVVRDLRRTTGKPVYLSMTGTDEEVDKAIAERLFPALVHLVRNAVDHGIESPEERVRAGKPSEGVVTIACTNRGNRVLEIVVSDDGAGIDRARVAERAGVSAQEADSDRQLLELLCRAGLSTKREVTTNSGRGMGMDIVLRSVEELSGELSVTSSRSGGTRFTLRVPLSLTIVDAFVLACARERYVVPVSAVEEIVELDAHAVRQAPMTGRSSTRRGRLFERRGEAVTLFDLAGMLDVAPGEPSASAPIALIVRRAGEPIAFAIDRVIGQQEAVVRPLRDPLVQVSGVAGTTDLGDGRATLVLDLGALAAAEERAA